MIKLTKGQLDYLNEQYKSLIQKLQVKEENQYFFIEVDKDTADKMRDWANDELQRKGFDVNYELNSEGKILEELIDVFYIE